ncbi:MAG: RecX family transcriptional regulator, partial [Pyramidobacter sp.]|nr:RecX family transcriptional regulator [Pyramidobacter sp.]
MNTNIDDFYALPQSSDMKWETILTRLLSVPRTRADLERRLRERGCPREAADELLDRYEQAGLIDDRAYAVLYV